MKKHLFARASAVLLTASIALAGLWAPTAFAQAEFPNRPVRIVMPFPPGSSTDNTARLLAQKLSDRWHQPVIVDNKPGGATNIAADLVAKSPPDGYTLLWATPSPLVINRMLFSRLPFDPDRFTRISLVTTTANVLVAHPAVGSSVNDLIRHAKADPAAVSYASTGIGTSCDVSIGCSPGRVWETGVTTLQSSERTTE